METMTQRIMLKLTKNLCRPQSGCITRANSTELHAVNRMFQV